MKRLTAEVGWASSHCRLFWTTTAGRQWKDITPLAASREEIQDIFFLDISSGWVLLSNYDDVRNVPRFDLAVTTNAGATWAIKHVSLPAFNAETMTLGGAARIDFVDTANGWMNLDVVSSSNFNLGAMLHTVDGGTTWQWVPEGPGVAGAIRFISKKEGWMAGGPGNEKLYVTRNGSNSWQEVSLKAPPGVYPATHTVYDLPVFDDGKHGFLPVTYSRPEGSGLALVLFGTNDGGRDVPPCWRTATSAFS